MNANKRKDGETIERKRKEQKKAERREEYLLVKIAKRMHEFDDEDNNKMFNMLDEDKFPEDIKNVL